MTASHTPNPTTASTAASVRTFFLNGPAGRLEAVLNQGAADAPFAALVCHPHPPSGGTMHYKVVYQTMKVMNAPEWGLGWPVLRFNFRGTGLSEGVHDGQAEAEDVRAALDWLRAEYGKPLIVAGFSFGSAMGLRACHDAEDVKGFAALGLPIQAEERNYQYHFLKDSPLPKLFISGDKDQFAPAGQLEEIIGGLAEPKQMHFISGAEHFFTGRITEMQNTLAEWLRSHFQGANSKSTGYNT